MNQLRIGGLFRIWMPHVWIFRIRGALCTEHWHRRKWSNGLFGVPPSIFAFHPWLSLYLWQLFRLSKQWTFILLSIPSMPSSASSKCYTIKPTNSQPPREHRRACDFRDLDSELTQIALKHNLSVQISALLRWLLEKRTCRSVNFTVSKEGD